MTLYMYFIIRTYNNIKVQFKKINSNLENIRIFNKKYILHEKEL